MGNKIIFIDVDGTLVDYENNLPESAVEAIRLARKNGYKVYICTGRSRAEVYDNIWDIGLDGMIGGNGSYVEDNNEVVMHKLITKEECIHIVDWLHERGLEFYLESNNGLFASEHFEEAGESVIQEYCKRKGKDEFDKMTVRKVFPEMIFDGELYRDDLNKVSFILNDYQDHLDSITEFPTLVANTWGGKGEEALFGDCALYGIDKAVAVNKLIDYLGVSRENVYAFGDASVDIPMFECAGTSVAVGSGGDEAKEAASYVTDAVLDDGIYNALKHFNLI